MELSTFDSQRWNGRVNFPVCLAPMVGLSHGALRAVLREYTPSGVRTLWPTEMLNSRKVPQQILGQTPETVGLPGEDGLAPQILGNEEKPIADSVSRLIQWGAVAIDINMGCPVQKALRHNYGVALMGDPGYAADVVAMAVRNSSVPISVKLRAGPQGDFDFLARFVAGLREAGASWITLHPRTPDQGRRGEADWSQIRRLREISDCPIIGNGDVQTADDVFAMLEQTRCDLVMSGRALAARPWLMWQVGERLGLHAPLGRTGGAPATREQEGEEYGRALLRLIYYSREMFGPTELALRKVRFHLRTTGPWLLFGHTLESLSHLAKSLDEFKPMVEDFFSQPQVMFPKTDLR